jgi:hypothetical protein
MTTISETFLQIICGAESEGLDPARAAQDYFAEKDSRITLAEAQALIARTKARHKTMEVSQ